MLHDRDPDGDVVTVDAEMTEGLPVGEDERARVQLVVVLRTIVKDGVDRVRDPEKVRE